MYFHIDPQQVSINSNDPSFTFPLQDIVPNGHDLISVYFDEIPDYLDRVEIMIGTQPNGCLGKPDTLRTMMCIQVHASDIIPKSSILGFETCGTFPLYKVIVYKVIV